MTPVPRCPGPVHRSEPAELVDLLTGAAVAESVGDDANGHEETA